MSDPRSSSDVPQRNGSQSYRSPDRIDTLRMLQGDPDPRSLSLATTYFGPPMSREGTTSSGGSRSHSTTPMTSGSDGSHELHLGASRRLSSSTGSTDRDSQKSPRRLHMPFSRSNTRTKAPVCSEYPLDHACFSAAGDMLYLWQPRATTVALLPIFGPENILSTQARVKNCGRAYFVAGGTSKYLVISQTSAPEAKIEIYSNKPQDGEPEFQPIHFQLSSSKTSFAISRDDKYVAMGSESSLKIWKLEQRTLRDICIRNTGKEFAGKAFAGQRVTSQRTAFTADSECVTVATRFSDGLTIIRVWNLAGEAVRDAVITNMPQGTGHDCGLSAVFSDNDLRTAIVTVMASNINHILQSFTRNTAFNWPSRKLQERRFSYKIVSAAQSASGLKYAMATSNNQIYAFSIAGSSVEVPEIANFSRDRDACVRLKDGITLACPDEQTVYAFWFGKSKDQMHLAIISNGQSTRLYNIRPRFGP